MADLTTTTPPDRFSWHPEYAGKTVAAVRARLRVELANDQRAYGLSLEGAEHQENAALARVVELEKRWGTFDMGWVETDPDELAARIVAFEQAREARRDLFPFSAYRDEHDPPPAPAAAQPWWRKLLGG